MGRCPECGEWNTLVETLVETPARSASPSRGTLVGSSQAYALPDIPTAAQERLPVPMGELSRVLGGGIVPGGVVLIGGDPGIGKSTLLLQLAAMMGAEGAPVLYVSGEESPQQIRLRAERLGIASPHLYVLAETNLDQILLQIENLRPRLAIVDSIQAVYSEAFESSAGSVSQVRECATALLRLGKAMNVPIFLVGHVTKTGTIAGPRVLEHIVDTVLQLEGERFHAYRLLRSIKNRYGSTNEVGVFEMRDGGMMEVTNPSQVFLEERMGHATGSAVAVTMEGTRPILVEIQGAGEQGRPGSPPAHSQRRGHEPAVVAGRSVEQAGGSAPGRSGYFHQRGGRPARSRAGGGPGHRGGHRLQLLQSPGARRPGYLWRGGAGRRTAQCEPGRTAPARGGQVGLSPGGAAAVAQRWVVRGAGAPAPSRSVPSPRPSASPWNPSRPKVLIQTTIDGGGAVRSGSLRESLTNIRHCVKMSERLDDHRGNQDGRRDKDVRQSLRAPCSLWGDKVSTRLTSGMPDVGPDPNMFSFI